MATPFSPFDKRPPKPILKRRQSELPSDLIDWDAPAIPELEKQRIIYEDHIKELKEDNEIETLLNEQIFKVVHDTVVDEYQSKMKKLEDEVSKERSRVNLLLGQLKMFETNVKDSDERVEELETELTSQRNLIINMELEKENWLEEKNSLRTEIENLNFRNNETTCELNHNLELYLQKKTEAAELKKSIDAMKNQLKHYKNLAKRSAVQDD